MIARTFAKLPLPAHYRTLLWSRSIRRPRGHRVDWPYYRAIQLALLGVSRDYGARFPHADAYTMLEFGVADGGSFQRMLHFRDVLRRHLHVSKMITCVGFDTFQGLPAPRPEDEAAPWHEGQFAADMSDVQERLARDHDGFELVKGLFADTLPAWKERLDREPPVFVAIDCDYYSSTIDVFDVILPLAPTGCMFYIDDPSAHYWSDRAGELRAIREVNEGRYGNHLQLTEYPLHVETGELRHYKQLYRLANVEKGGFVSGADE
jgi:macrocin-O-methyltransferase TylF-like protien